MPPASENFSITKRIDLHCHSSASNKPAEAVLTAIGCPESYSDPEEVYAQARARGMDFVTITDHDSINGVEKIAYRNDVLTGEELTCWFPEDQCKMHVLLWGLNRADHDAVQSMAQNIYEVAAYVEEKHIAHAVAHPLYRQNDKLEKWHLERLILLFKGFECLNGSHSALHREAFEPMLNKLDRAAIQRLSERHMLLPRWSEPWAKSRTAGSDDHGLLSIGRTWTEFPSDTKTTSQILQCIRDGQCRPGGEAGSSIKLAHNFLAVAVRYYSRQILPKRSTKPNTATVILQTIVGERKPPTKVEMAKMVVRSKIKKWFKRKPEGSSRLIRELFLKSARENAANYPDLRALLGQGLPPLGEHGEMFKFISDVNRDVVEGFADEIDDVIQNARFTGLFDSISAILAHQFVMLPYYFAFFHQNRERKLLRRLTGEENVLSSDAMRVGLFTDTFDEINGVARFIRDMGEQAALQNLRFTIHTCSTETRIDLPYRKNFSPLLSRRLPYYAELQLNLPPIIEIMEWADRQQFDAIHVSTPGPMGLCGWIISKMLRVPCLGTYHTDFPAYVQNLTRDHRMTGGTRAYMKWFYNRMAKTFSRSREYQSILRNFQLDDSRLAMTLPGINTEKFHPKHRDSNLWARHGVTEARKLLYCGRVSVEKNLPMLVDVFKRLCEARKDVALVVAGDGPYLEAMKEALRGQPAYFLGYQNDQQLGPIYAGSDLFVFPSRTDTLGQVVMEAQASGLPVLVSDEGGPKEMMDDGVTGLVLPAAEPDAWVEAIYELLSDEPRRLRMARTAPTRISRFSLEKTFEAFWAEHLVATQQPPKDELPVSAPDPLPVR